MELNLGIELRDMGMNQELVKLCLASAFWPRILTFAAVTRGPRASVDHPTAPHTAASDSPRAIARSTRATRAALRRVCTLAPEGTLGLAAPAAVRCAARRTSRPPPASRLVKCLINNWS
jgi:hypothetical protein